MLKRLRAQEECDDYIENLKKNQEFNDLYTQISQKQLEILKNSYNESVNELKKDVEVLQNKIDAFLKTNNIDKSNLEPKYDCPLCKDTGVFNGKMCSCLINEVNKQISNMISSQTEFKSFENCDKDIMDETDKKTFTLLKTWCDKFPNVTKINLNITGGAGTGKTYLLECVANELMKKNVAVCYITAFELNEMARLYHIGKSYDFADCMNVDVLLIDDLGTEPVLRNVTKEYLYNLINVRQINNKPTFITSNLSLDNILSRYDDRIFSRLGNKNLAVNIVLTSQDKRIK